MVTSSRTPEGWPNKCPLCGLDLRIEPSPETLTAPCPGCGQLLWLSPSGDIAPILDVTQLPDQLVPTDLADDIHIPDFVIELIPQSFAFENRVLPVAEGPGSSLTVAVADPTDIETIEKLRFTLNRSIWIVHVTADWLAIQLREHYNPGTDDLP